MNPRRTFVCVCFVLIVLDIGWVLVDNALRIGVAADAREYAAWCKLERRTDITYDEWVTLRNAGLLTRH